MENNHSFPPFPPQPPFGFPPLPAPEPEPLYNKFLQVGRQGKNEGWRYLVGAIIILIGGYSLLGQIPLLFLLKYGVRHGYIDMFDKDLSSKVLSPQIMHLDPNIIFLVEMFIFVGGMIALWITVRFLHQKKFLSIITSAPKIRWKRLAISALTWTILCFAGQFLSMQLTPGNYTFVFNPGPFFVTLALALLFLPVQTWWEEFFLRGYLFQGIGQKTKSAWLPILITGTAFGLMHMFNPEVKAYGVAAMLPAYLLPGIFLAMMAALDEGLESAMGMHLANNLFGTIGVTSANSAIQANTIWVAKEMTPATDNIVLFVSFLILMAVLWKTNRWEFQKLYR